MYEKWIQDHCDHIMNNRVNKGKKRANDSKFAKVQLILKQATERVWQADPETRAIQQRLMATSYEVAMI